MDHDIIIFHRLDKDQIRQIVKLQLDMLNKRLAANKVVLKFSKEALDKITEQGYDPQFGARPLKRVIQKQIEDRLALEILSGKIQPGEEIRVSIEEDKFIFKD